MTSNTPTETTVELSPGQLSAIQIAPVRTYPFPVEKEEVGSVSFAEDPAIVPAESTLLGAAATFTAASKQLARARELYQSKGVSQSELEQDIANEQTAEAALKAAQSALRALGKTDAQIDQMIAAGKIEPPPAARGPTKWAVADVPEADIPLFRVGQPVGVKVLAYPNRVFKGRISRIDATVDPNLHRQTVRCEVADPKNELRPGMLATVVIQVHKPVESIAIPANGVVREGDGTLTAWVTTDRRHFTQKIIKTGIREDGEVQILHGPQPGELVVTDGAIFLDNMANALPSD
ncbi:MAG: efflux RND transporter periplasmic adaptor subunit [Verrucomicrobiota bacterium]|nr:efflux RND transporter periplasmic adaptor subunit [Verrucomicrobiota bacterium]